MIYLFALQSNNKTNESKGTVPFDSFWDDEMTKEKAQELIQIMKRLLKTGVYELPKVGTMDKLPLQSQQSSKVKFDVYINRKGRIDPKKYTLLLHFSEEDLLRIDVHGTDHHNPDGTVVPCPHIHMRMKDTGRWDSYAYDIPAVFGDTEDCALTVRDFLHYCNTNNINEITICEQKGLFI